MQLATTTEAKQALILPPGNVTIRAFVCDVVNSCTNYFVAHIFVPPVIFSLASSKAFSIDAEKTIQLGSVDRFLLSALSAATAITAQSSNRIRNRHLNQVLCFDQTHSHYAIFAIFKRCFLYIASFQNKFGLSCVVTCPARILTLSNLAANF